MSSRSGGADDASPMRQAALIHDALGRLGVKRPILVAHSLGGAVATAYALSFPDDVSGLVLIAPTTHPWEGGIAWYYSLATAPVIGPLFAWTYALPVGSLLVPNAIASVFAPQPPPADYQNRAGIMQVLRPKTFLANAQDVAALNGNLRRQFERYRDIRVPTVVITGDRDRTVSLDIHARALAAAIPDARLEILRGRRAHAASRAAASDRSGDCACAGGRAIAALSVVGSARSDPTKAMRTMLVAPGVPSGTPATMMTRRPAFAKPSLNAMRQARSTMSSWSCASSATTQCTPQTSDNFRPVERFGEIATIGGSGRSRATRQARSSRNWSSR